MPAVTSVAPRRGTAATRRVRPVRVVLLTVGILALVLAGVIVAVLWTVSSAFQSVEKIPTAFPPTAERPPAVTGEAAEAQNFLVLGSDSRGEDGSLADIAGQHSDTIVVVHIPADRSALNVMSIPRDSWVDMPGHGEARISAALLLGGVPLAVQAVEELIGVRVDHVAVVDFAGFKGVTDALGGVDIDNPVAFNSYYLEGHTFAAGPQHLDGTEALAFARERAAFGDGDLQRVRNQQLLIRAMFTRLLQQETLTNPVRVGSVIGTFTPHVAIDEEITTSELVALGVELRELRSGDVRFFTIPATGTGTGPDGESIVTLDRSALPALQKAFRADALDE